MPAFSAGAAIIGAKAQSKAAGKAADAEIEFARETRDYAEVIADETRAGNVRNIRNSYGLQRKNINDTYRRSTRALRDGVANATDQVQLYKDSGDAALAAQRYELGIGPKPEGYEGFKGTEGYRFRRGEADDAVENSAAASGMGMSGATLRRLQETGDGMAADEYQANYGRLSEMTGRGARASEYIGNMENGLAQGQTQLETNRGTSLGIAEGARTDGLIAARSNASNTKLGFEARTNDTISSALSNEAIAKGNAFSQGAQGVAQGIENGLRLATGFS